ncbi:MAG: translation factor GTPase family protein [Dermatophilaceae bacterium]
MPFLNLGILAHVDAGKTSLTERLLYEAGVLDAPGSVDKGTTRTDSMDLERRRGITIRAAVTSFDLGAVTVNVLDTPGHPDFIAEVERSLAVLDAAVLVVSAVEGVQPQTVVLWRALRLLAVPTILFANKIDRVGADLERVLVQARSRLTSGVVPLSVVESLGHQDVTVDDADVLAADIVENVASVDESLLRRWVDGTRIGRQDVRLAMVRGINGGSLTPLLAGSAITGAGLAGLQRTLTEIAPHDAELLLAPAAGSVFKIDRDDRGRRTWVRMWSGSAYPRERLHWSRPGREVVTEIEVSCHGGLQRAGRAVGGQVAVLRGLNGSRVGDTFGQVPARVTHHFPPATLQALVEPIDPTRRGALFTALTELAEGDPLIDLRVSGGGDRLAVSLHGEVQKEVIASLLKESYAVPVRFLDTVTVCIERVVGTGTSIDLPHVGGNPYLAGIGLRVDARPAGHGLEFSPGIERGNLPPAFIAATEEGVRAAYAHGLHGWAVTDCLVTMTRSAYWPRQSAMHAGFSKGMSSVAADFRLLAQVVAMAALHEAGTRVCEPVERFDIEVPLDVLGGVVALLGPLGGLVESSTVAGDVVCLAGRIPSARIPEVVRALPDLAAGEAVLTHRHDSYAAMTDRPTVRQRHGPDPLDRESWFRAMPR